jgi:thiamine monophosphate synthase
MADEIDSLEERSCSYFAISEIEKTNKKLSKEPSTLPTLE